MMRKLILLFAVTLSLAFGASAQLLYKVTAPGMESRPSYVFGTHHVAPVSMIDSVVGLRDALASCDVVYGEVVSDDLTDPQRQQALAMMLMAPADSTLTRLLTSAQQDSLSVVLAKYFGPMVGVQQVDMLKPAALLAQLMVMQSAQAFPDFNPQKLLDVELQSIVKSAGKPNRGLESVEWQMNLLYGTPLIKQAADLMKYVANDGESVAYMRRLADAYCSQDMAAMGDLFADPVFGMDSGEMDRLCYDRNDKWAELLVGMIPTGSIMVCVGAGHLLGDRGLLGLFRKAGFDVKPVSKI